MHETTMTIPVKFSPDISPDNPYSRNYSDVLWFEYDEHPNKVLKGIYTAKLIRTMQKFCLPNFRTKFNAEVR